MEKTINERFVKISSRIPYPVDLQLGQDIEIGIGGRQTLGNVVKTEDMDNQDGTINRIYTVKFLST
jgi:hypothetical protein